MCTSFAVYRNEKIIYGMNFDTDEIYISFKKDLSKRWKISIIEKTIQSLDGFLSNNKIQFTNGEIFVKDLISLYK